MRITRLLAAIALIVLLPIPPTAQSASAADPWPALVARAKDVVARLASGDVEKLIDGFSDTMKAAAGPDQLHAMVSGLTAQVGAFTSVGATRTAERDGCVSSP